MENRIKEIATRIQGLRAMLKIDAAQMAKETGLEEAEYLQAEEGNHDYSFTFLYNCANALGVDITEIITGKSPTLSTYTIERKSCGLPIKRRAGFEYLHKASRFKNRAAQPFYVTAPAQKEDAEITLSSHEGQEFDFILKGSLKVNIDGHIETLSEGDSIYYDGTTPHGMNAVGNTDCEFLAVVIK